MSEEKHPTRSPGGVAWHRVVHNHDGLDRMGRSCRFPGRKWNQLAAVGPLRHARCETNDFGKLGCFDPIPLLCRVARSPSGKAKVCKTFIGGSIPPRASKTLVHQSEHN